MRAKKNFIVIAYDIANDRRRDRITKALTKVGTRVNYSVFECLLTDKQYEKLKIEISAHINEKEDSIIYYPICLECYTKIIYQPSLKRKFERVVSI